MGYEVDFIPAGGGLAAVVRWGRPGKYQVLVYDGGTVASGMQVVAHVEARCGISRVDYVVSSHPGRDHAGGLAVVLGRLKVGELWMHQPWLHSTSDGAMAGPAPHLARVARTRGVPVHEPFEGALIGPFTVLSPQRRWYVDALLPEFVDETAMPDDSTRRDLASCARGVAAWAAKRLDLDLLPRRATTSARHESSAVLYAEFEGRGVLLTGNAGAQALDHACTFAEHLGLRLPCNLRFLQIPDRGNAGHLTSALLDRIVGERQPGAPGACTKTAFISADRGTPPFLYRAAVDALARQRVASFVTRGLRLHHAHDMPERHWRTAAAVSHRR